MSGTEEAEEETGGGASAAAAPATDTANAAPAQSEEAAREAEEKKKVRFVNVIANTIHKHFCPPFTGSENKYTPKEVNLYGFDL